MICTNCRNVIPQDAPKVNDERICPRCGTRHPEQDGESQSANPTATSSVGKPPMNVTIFVTDIGLAAAAKAAGSVIERVPPRSLIPTADAALGLNGALASHFANKQMAFEDAPMMSDDQWKAFLDARFPGRRWNRWFGKTPSAIFSVVIVFEAEVHPQSPLGLEKQIRPTTEEDRELSGASSELPSTVREPDQPPSGEAADFAGGSACECGNRLPATGFLCVQCGRPKGWKLTCLPERDAIKELTCAKCPDVLIPADAVFFLKVLDVEIKCPLCEAVLATAERTRNWNLEFLDASPLLENESALVEYSKKAREQGSSLPAISIGGAVAAQEQLAGLLLLRWLEKHPSPSKAIVEELSAQFLGRFKLGAFTTEGIKDLYTNNDFLTSMHYGSVFVHQVDNRSRDGFTLHGARARLILNLQASFPRWGATSMNTLTYDGRLAMTELVYSLDKDRKAHRGDINKENAYQQFATVLVTAVPSRTEAVGCKKSGAAGGSGCFVATAAFSASAPEVQSLREFRDTVLLTSIWGRRFVSWYYRCSPSVARLIERRDQIRLLVRLSLLPIVWMIRRKEHTNADLRFTRAMPTATEKDQGKV